MDDDVVSMTQGYRLGKLLLQARLRPSDIRLPYLHNGGTVGEREIDAYIHRCLVLPAEDRDALAWTANELTRNLGLLPAPYSYELWDQGRMSPENRHQ